MWFKLILLLIYVSVLFILARLLEAASWVETGVLSHRLLDPMTLSVLKLKTLLEQRGVSYDGVVEKPELSELVDATGKYTSKCTGMKGKGGKFQLNELRVSVCKGLLE